MTKTVRITVNRKLVWRGDVEEGFVLTAEPIEVDTKWFRIAPVKRKRGRPVIRTDAERRAIERAWYVKNRDRILAKHREAKAAKKNNQ